MKHLREYRRQRSSDMQDIEFQRVSTVSVHFVLEDDVVVYGNVPGTKVAEESLNELKTEQDLFAIVSRAFEFPDYFGTNWDALDECLRDLEWLESRSYVLVLRDAEEGWSSSSYVLGQFVKTWLHASKSWAAEGVPFHLVFVM